jgi:hypothetical protein
MPNAFPCPNTPPSCECIPFPVRNFSQEDPDFPVTFCTVTVAARTGTSFASPCTQTCERPLGDDVVDGDCSSSSETFICAQSEAQDCQNHDPDPPNVYSTTFFNRQQTCTVECPDNSTFDWTVPAGVIGSAWQADADARAYGLACKRAMSHRICFVTESPLTPMCAGVFASVPIIAQGGTAPYVFSIESGALPAGLAFEPVGLIEGTPTTGGSSTFTIRVTDSIGSFQLKQFTQRVVEITSPTALPGGTQLIAYSYTLLTTGTSGTVVWSLASGALPDGLSLSTVGVISGTPTVPGSFSFNLSLIDGAGASCSKDFTLAIAPGVLIRGYWSYDDYSFGPNKLLDATPNNHDLDIFAAFSVVPGKVGNCMSTFSNRCETFGPNINQFDYAVATGFTICGWTKFDFDQSGIISIWIVTYGGDGINLVFDTDSLRMNTTNGDDLFAPYPADGDWHFFRSWIGMDQKMNLQIDMGTIFQSAPLAFGDLVCSQFQLQGPSSPGPDTPNGFDETGYWSRVLSDAEANQLWNSGSGVTWPNVPA